MLRRERVGVGAPIVRLRRLLRSRRPSESSPAHVFFKGPSGHDLLPVQVVGF
jgi:hypothetical protein